MEVLYNPDKLKDEEITKRVRRAKLIAINENNQILLVNCYKDYFLVGGHVEENENDYDCIKREILEEIGTEIEFNELKRVFCVRYLNKNYPEEGINTEYETNYYYLKINIVPNYNNMNITEYEKEGNFRIEYIEIKDVIPKLSHSLAESTHPNVVRDTIFAIDECLKQIYKK